MAAIGESSLNGALELLKLLELGRRSLDVGEILASSQ